MELEDALNWERYWRKPNYDEAELKQPTAAYWDDPRSDVQGMLTSEYIQFYDDIVGGMIYPFNEKLLKPASYELTLGWRYLVEGEDRLLSEEEPWLEIPENSIAFVSMQQVLRLPHYIVGRFDLAIEYIYQGLLLGTGPQVDPGFQGALGCPLHNISNESIYLRLGEPFAKIDFVKTAPPLHARRTVEWRKEVETEALLAERAQQEDPPPHRKHVKLFKDGKPKWREPIFDYTQGKRPQSSVAPLKKAVETLQRYGVIGLVSLFLTAGGFLILYVNAKTEGLPSSRELNEVRRESRADGRETRQQLEVLESRLRRLQDQLP